MALKNPERMVKSARTAFEIVEYIHEQDGVDLTELTEHFELAKSTVHRYLATLESLEYIVQDGGTYRIGLKFLSLGMAARNSVPLVHVADDTLADLTEQTSLVAWLVVEEHGRAVYVDSAENGVAPTYGRVSKRTDIHATAGGKAILAHLPDDEVRAIVDTYKLPERTEHTITDEKELSEELTTIRDRGYARSDHEIALGVLSVAAPVLDGSSPLGAISISAMSNQVDSEQFDSEYADMVRKAAREVSERYTERYE